MAILALVIGYMLLYATFGTGLDDEQVLSDWMGGNIPASDFWDEL